MRAQHCQVRPPRGWDCSPPARWVDLPMLRPHSPTVRVGPTPCKGWAHLQGGQRSVSLEYQTCTSAYLFDTLVTGKGWATSDNYIAKESLLFPRLFRSRRLRVHRRLGPWQRTTKSKTSPRCIICYEPETKDIEKCRCGADQKLQKS